LFRLQFFESKAGGPFLSLNVSIVKERYRNFGFAFQVLKKRKIKNSVIIVAE
jgi:hypothetical protein